MDQSKPHSPLYHYTTVAGAVGIIQNRCIWSTDFRFLNDASEGQHFLVELERRVKEIHDATHPGSIASPAGEATEWSIRLSPREHAMAMLERYKNMLASRGFLGVTSFSANGDHLNQWRAYGGHQGVALEFDTSCLPSGLFECLYGKADEVVQSILDETERDRRSPRDYADVLYRFVAQRAIRYAVRIKDGRFHEEQEWRLISKEYGGFADYLSSHGPMPDVEFRAGRLTPIPYIKLELSPGSIIGAIIGPGPDQALTRSGIELALQEKLPLASFPRQDSGFNVDNVRCSALPYRGYV